MKTKILITYLLFGLTSLSHAYEKMSNVHCPLGCPSVASNNTFVIHHIFTLSNNPKTKFADWVAYEVNIRNFGVTPGRDFKADHMLDKDDTLEESDYKGANRSELKAEKGHLAPLATFASNQYWYETNLLSNITPQHNHLNNGPWKYLEIAVREAVRFRESLYVIAGTTYTESNRMMPNADEPHDIPYGFFKIIYDRKGNSAFFHMNQTTGKKDLYCSKTTTLAEIENMTNLSFPVFKYSDHIMARLGC